MPWFVWPERMFAVRFASEPNVSLTVKFQLPVHTQVPSTTTNLLCI